MKFEIFADGSSDLEKGTSGHGWIIYKDGDFYNQDFGSSTEGLTNNQEEYNAVIAALEELVCFSGGIFGDENDEVLIKTDSELVVKQLTGVYKCRKPHLKPLKDRALELIKECPMKISIQHIHREYNTEADSLARDGLNAANLE